MFRSHLRHSVGHPYRVVKFGEPPIIITRAGESAMYVCMCVIWLPVDECCFFFGFSCFFFTNQNNSTSFFRVIFFLTIIKFHLCNSIIYLTFSACLLLVTFYSSLIIYTHSHREFSSSERFSVFFFYFSLL